MVGLIQSSDDAADGESSPLLLHEHTTEPLTNSKTYVERTSLKLFDNIRDLSGWSFSVSEHSLERLDQCKHNSELYTPASDKVYVHVDARMSGLGGYDSWTPNIAEEHLVVPRKDMEVQVLLIPIPEGRGGRAGSGVNSPLQIYHDTLLGKYGRVPD